jgi:hypothetical protein
LLCEHRFADDIAKGTRFGLPPAVVIDCDVTKRVETELEGVGHALNADTESNRPSI